MQRSIVIAFFVFLGAALYSRQIVAAPTLAQKLSGRILLQVEVKGEAWYVNPVDLKRYYLGRPTDAFALMRTLGLGVTNRDFDSWGSIGGTYVPQRLSGRILIKVEDAGRAYYVFPGDTNGINNIHSLGRPEDAFAVMRKLGLGITNKNLGAIPIGLGPAVKPTTSAGNHVDVDIPTSDNLPPVDTTQPVLNPLRITSAQPTIEKELYSGQQMKHIHVDVVVSYPTLKRVENEWKMDVVLDARTVDAQGKPANFFNDSPISRIDFQTPYKLTTATFVLDARVPESQVGTYTTTLTARDQISGSAQDTVVLKIEL
ncbi:hypothetical protein HZA86_00250 [Candidatus Uhrbacteria bacterium]|nr:hypothetical protein [Candidatus Uhrbacteria bacterium]